MIYPKPLVNPSLATDGARVPPGSYEPWGPGGHMAPGRSAYPWQTLQQGGGEGCPHCKQQAGGPGKLPSNYRKELGKAAC